MNCGGVVGVLQVEGSNKVAGCRRVLDRLQVEGCMRLGVQALGEC